MRLNSKITLLLALGSVKVLIMIVETAMSRDDLLGINETFRRNLNAAGEQLDAPQSWNKSLQGKQTQTQRDEAVNSSRRIVQVANQYPKIAPQRAVANDKFVSHRVGNKQLPSGNAFRRKKAAQPFRRLNIGERFPEYGTAEFTKRCSWAEGDRALGVNCTILVKDRKDENGGISSWFSRVVHGFIHAMQAGCRFRVAYDQSVDISKLLASNGHLDSWIAPPGFNCDERDQCYSVNTATISADAVIPFPFRIPNVNSTSLASVPNYRWAYSGDNTNKLFRPMFHDLETKLPGFQIESGMACSLGTLFHLAPTASEFEPRLFPNILPALRDRDALVMTLYIRTGYTDEVAAKEEAGEAATEAQDHRRKARQILDCALTLEARHLAEDASAASSFSRVVWMVVTDSPGLKQWIAETYDGKDASSPTHQGGVPREVILTGSRGIHTRARRNPSTADFADALIDWWLIGESDVLVAHSHLTFGFTGALRTNRPFFDADGCSRQIMVHERLAA